MTMSLSLSHMIAVVLFVTALNHLPQAHARSDSQLHIRSGLINGSYSGQFSGRFSVPMGLDVDHETFYSSANSYYFRFTMAIDSPAARPFYTYSGVGHKFYFNSRGKISDLYSKELSLAVQPTWKFYLAADAGVAQVIVKTFGTVLQSVSNMFELGGHVGAIYQFNRRAGIEAQVGGTLGYGISSVAVNGTTNRVFIGFNYYF